MLQYPSGAEYVEALQHPELCFNDPALKSADVAVDKLGLPRPISGNFASVFDITTRASGQRFAIKCFTRNVPDQNTRYHAISDKLSTVNETWKVNFNYESDGIVVHGDRYPFLKMEWVEGTSLINWIDQNLQRPHSLTAVADNFLKLIQSLEENGIAHGDLQHGNVLVARDESLRLVDYDGMFVPALSGKRAAEQGHRNYQSPFRSDEFNPAIDRFSAWVIYLSLAAIVHQPALWMQLRSQDAEHLLLCEEDFRDPAGSARFPSLLNHNSPAIREMSQRLLSHSLLPTAEMPQLEAIDLAAKSAPMPSIVSPSALAKESPGGLPSWLSSHLKEEEPTLPPVTFTGRDLRTAFIGVTLPIALLAIGIISTVFTMSFTSRAYIAAAILSICAMASYLGYRSRDEVAARKPHLLQRKTNRKTQIHHKKTARGIEKRIELFEKSERTRPAQQAIKRESLNKSNRDRISKLESDLKRELAKIAKSRTELGQRKARDLTQALHTIQDAHVTEYLSRIKLTSAALTGIGPKLVSNLRAHGISTAADLTNVRYVRNGQSTAAYLVLRTGAQMRVPGVGEVKARALHTWVLYHEEAARRSMPQSLPGSAHAAITARYATAEQQINDSEAQAKTDVQNRRAAVNREFSAKLAELADAEKKANIASAQERVDLTRTNAATSLQISTTAEILDCTQRDIERYDSISFPRYLAFIYTG